MLLLYYWNINCCKMSFAEGWSNEKNIMMNIVIAKSSFASFLSSSDENCQIFLIRFCATILVHFINKTTNLRCWNYEKREVPQEWALSYVTHKILNDVNIKTAKYTYVFAVWYQTKLAIWNQLWLYNHNSGYNLNH